MLDRKIAYWVTSAENDWKVAGHLFEKGDYPYALFFGHLTLEKVLKALYAAITQDNPPLTHRLVLLADKTGLHLSDEQLDLLEAVTDFNLEARYPDEKFSFHKRCNKEFAQQYLARIEEMMKWLLQRIPSSTT